MLEGCSQRLLAKQSHSSEAGCVLVGSGRVLVWESFNYGGLGRGEINNTKGWYRYRLGTWGKQGGPKEGYGPERSDSVREATRKKKGVDRRRALGLATTRWILTIMIVVEEARTGGRKKEQVQRSGEKRGEIKPLTRTTQVNS